MLKGRKEKLRKVRRLKGKKGRSEEGEASHIRLISKFDPDKEFYRSVNITDRMTIKILKATIYRTFTLCASPVHLYI